MVVIRKDGTRENVTTEDKGPTEAQRLLAASRTTGHLRTTLLLWGIPEPAWWQLYRIVEEIEVHLGASVAKKGYCLGNERQRFRRSANSAEASGPGARHAPGKSDPPKNPMTLQDPKTFVKALLEQALQ